jgi:hypothetical protein
MLCGNTVWLFLPMHSTMLFVVNIEMKMPMITFFTKAQFLQKMQSEFPTPCCQNLFNNNHIFLQKLCINETFIKVKI